MIVILFFLILHVSTSWSVSVLTPTECIIEFERDINKGTFEVRTDFYVKLSGNLKEFQVKLPKRISLCSIHFLSAPFELRGNPDYQVQGTFIQIDEKTDIATVNFITPVKKEDAKEGGYISISYSGNIAKKSETQEAVHYLNENDIEVNQKKNQIFPVLVDNESTKVELKVITEKGAKVEPGTGLVAGKSFDNFNSKYVNVFNSKNNIKTTTISFKVKAKK